MSPPVGIAEMEIGVPVTLAVFLASAVVCVVGALVAGLAEDRSARRAAMVVSAALLGGALWLALFVFSGDPYTDGEGSRWSHRESHGLVYAAWIASALAVILIGVLARRHVRWLLAATILGCVAVVCLQVVAANSQNLN